MTKKKWIIIIAVCLAVLGVFEWKTKKTYDADTSQVNQIVVVQTSDKVKIKVSDDQNIHVSYYEGVAYKYNIDLNDNVLEITGNNIIPINLDLQDAALTIEVPKDSEQTVEINTEKTCSVDDSLNFKNIQINSEDSE